MATLKEKEKGMRTKWTRFMMHRYVVNTCIYSIQSVFPSVLMCCVIVLYCIALCFGVVDVKSCTEQAADDNKKAKSKSKSALKSDRRVGDNSVAMDESECESDGEAEAAGGEEDNRLGQSSSNAADIATESEQEGEEGEDDMDIQDEN